MVAIFPASRIRDAQFSLNPTARRVKTHCVMKEILLGEWPLLKDALLIAAALPLSVLFPMAVVDWSMGEKKEPEYELPFRF
jgi:hypothetical protein